ncbi:MAG: trehalose-phosphatase [Nitrospiraceae bacterium]
MIELFSERGLAQLEALSRTRALYAFDFDGTLAEIVRERDHAKLRSEVRQALHDLGRLAPTAVISGRALEDLRSRIDGTVPYLIGNHGLEGTPDETTVRDQARIVSRSWREQLGASLAQLHDEGITLEDKTYSLTLHFRGTRNSALARRKAKEALSRLTPAPRIIQGKGVVNAVPAGSPDKGAAIRSLMHHLNTTTALYVGDDETDEDVFALPDASMVTVRIGKKRDSCAQFYLADQEQVARLLADLVERLSTRSSPHTIGESPGVMTAGRPVAR